MTNLVITELFADVNNVYHSETGPASEAITKGQYCRFDTSTGKITPAKATTAGECRDGGLATKTVAAGQTVTIVISGIVDVGDALSAIAYDADIYLSDTDGLMTNDEADATIVKRVATVIPGWGGGGTADKLLWVRPTPTAEAIEGVTATPAELNILDGATLSTAELNILDGVTATAAELNILDGVTADASELNKLDGVTGTTAQINLAVKETAQVLSGDGAITVKNGTVFITKTSAAAITLADPTTGTDDGKQLMIMSTTAFAHTVTNTTGFNGAGGTYDVATAQNSLTGSSSPGDGQCLFLIAYLGKWFVVNVGTWALA